MAHFIREWRNHRDLTMERLADKCGISVSVLSRVERGRQQYNEHMLERVAAALGVRPSILVSFGPSDPQAELSTATPSEVAQLVAILRAMRSNQP